MTRHYRVISADGHVETPPDPWVRHVPERWRDRAPRLVPGPDGGEAWVVEGRPLLPNGQNVTGRGPVRFAGASYYRADGSPIEGAGDGVQRLQEQDEDGIDAEVLFPPVFASRFIEGVADRDVYVALVQAYNTFLAEDYCSVAPDRLIGCAVIPVTGIDDAVAELRRIHGLGLRGVAIHQFPNGTGAPTPEDDRFWATALELGVALAPHQGFGDQVPPPLPVGAGTKSRTLAASLIDRIGSLRPAYCLAQLMTAGVFDRFPEIQLYYAESNAAWLASALYHFDDTFRCYNEWFQADLPRLPSEYIREHVFFGMIRDPLALQLGDFLPLDRLMWGSDFPHSVGTYPGSQEYIAEAFAHLDDATRQMILVDNPCRFFGLDPQATLTETPERAMA
jgi:predicted TIM-barrel fold metal-dependent hydrolase